MVRAHDGDMFDDEYPMPFVKDDPFGIEARLMEEGALTCSRCSQIIEPGTASIDRKGNIIHHPYVCPPREIVE
jgi:hypothetical protein